MAGRGGQRQCRKEPGGFAGLQWWVCFALEVEGELVERNAPSVLPSFSAYSFGIHPLKNNTL